MRTAFSFYKPLLLVLVLAWALVGCEISGEFGYEKDGAGTNDVRKTVATGTLEMGGL